MNELNYKYYTDTRNTNKKNNFKVRKENTLKSLKDVEYFLTNWKKIWKGIKIYKILK